MVFAGLDEALSGLRVAQRQLDVLSNNISNAQVEGFTRKTLPQSTVVLLGEGSGVSSDPIIRTVDFSLQRDLFEQTSLESFLTTQVDQLNRVQQFHGGPDAEAAFSAVLSDMRDSFVKLDNDPSNAILQQQSLTAAQNMASRINDFGSLVQTIRNDAENSISSAVNTANSLLEDIADLNRQIKIDASVDRSTAALKDQRDRAITELSEILELSFFERGDGVLVVQTARGVELADESAKELFFQTSNLGPNSFYPDDTNNSARGIFVGGDPDENQVAFDIAAIGAELGGELGALLDLRDSIMPRFQAQIDELAANLAARFDAQGLRLFTDNTGDIPDISVDPDLTTDPPTPVEYVGFAQQIQVNPLVEADPSLIQQGTLTDTDNTIQAGSNEVIRRILDFAMGDTFEQQATTQVFDADLPLQNSTQLDIISVNEVEGTVDLSSFTSVEDLISAAGGNIESGSDSFIISFSDTDITSGSVTVSLDLSDITPDPSLSAAGEIIAAIETQISGNGTADLLNISLSEGSNGELVIDTRGDFTINNTDSTLTDAISADALNTYIGFPVSTFEAEDPYFDIRVGNNDFVRISIDPNDTIQDLAAKLDLELDSASSNITGVGVPDLEVILSGDTTSGFSIALSPGENFGGSMDIIGGPFESESDGSTIISGLFGSANPIINVDHPAFRSQNLGPGANVTSQIRQVDTLIEFAQSAVDNQTVESINKESRLEDEQAFKQALERQFLDESGVNIDEEVANLIVIQNAYSAAARALSAIDQLFQELLNTFR